MIIIALFTLFDLLARILQLIGIETEESSSVQPFSWFRSSSQDEMNSELLEKYNAGKSIIDSEIRQLVNRAEQSKKNRDSITSTSSSGNSQVKIQQVDLAMIKPLSFDDIEENNSRPGFNLFGKSKSNYSSAPSKTVNNDDYEPSIFSSTLSANNNSRNETVMNPLRDPSATASSNKPRSSLTSTANNSKSSLPPPKSSIAPKSTSTDSRTAPKSTASKQPPPKKVKDVFSFDDEDDDNSGATGGRYANF